MGMDVNATGQASYYGATGAGGQNLPPEKKKEGLPWGQIATTVGVGLYTSIGGHLNHQSQKSLLNKLNDLDFTENVDAAKFINNLPIFQAFQIGKANPGELFINKAELQKTQTFLSKLDLDNTAKHLGKNIGWAALAAGATALIYGGIRTLVNRNKQPQSTPTPPTA